MTKQALCMSLGIWIRRTGSGRGDWRRFGGCRGAGACHPPRARLAWNMKGHGLVQRQSFVVPGHHIMDGVIASGPARVALIPVIQVWWNTTRDTGSMRPKVPRYQWRVTWSRISVSSSIIDGFRSHKSTSASVCRCVHLPMKPVVCLGHDSPRGASPFSIRRMSAVKLKFPALTRRASGRAQQVGRSLRITYRLRWPVDVDPARGSSALPPPTSPPQLQCLFVPRLLMAQTPKSPHSHAGETVSVGLDAMSIPRLGMEKSAVAVAALPFRERPDAGTRHI